MDRQKIKIENSPAQSVPAISTTGILGVAFVILKLIGKIDWPWIWVTAPFWIPIVLAALLLIILGIAVIISNR